jgi:hypothetical protein
MFQSAPITTYLKSTTDLLDGWALQYVFATCYSNIAADVRQMTWVFVIMSNTYDVKLGQWRSDAHSLLSAQELWFAAFMTIL